jgi:molybdate transport system substrate-binding protein
MRTRYFLLLCLFGTLAGCDKAGKPAATPSPPVRVFAATSTRKAVDEIAAKFTSATGVRVECEFDASGSLARKIEHGADADLFLSADEEWADYVEKKDLLARRRTLLTNRLVVVVPADSKLAVKDLADVAGEGVKRLAVGADPVPAGRYARQALKKGGVWEKIEGRLLEGKDVAAVLLYVARDEADAGFVYATDAAASGKVRVAYEVPENFTVPIRYPLVTLKRDRPNPDADRLADYLAGDAAGVVFRKAGFGLAN